MTAGDGRKDRAREKRAAEETAGVEFNDLYSVEYLAEVAGGNARAERLEELKRRIALGAYKPDPDAIAEGMLSRVGIEADED
jgi:anti-sigma28 factor (negative regulator of flagellin synthesis)